jgi:dCTP deaminase
MILTAHTLAKELGTPHKTDPFVLAPTPDLSIVRTSGAAAIDLRLGTWFLTAKTSRHTVLDIYNLKEPIPTERDIMRRMYVPLGEKFILHPRSFVLAATLEWIRMPKRFAGYVNGRSSWGRRGLVIETAPGVHPGFSGCLTLELANVGEIPIALMPGTSICQLFMHIVRGSHRSADKSAFIGYRAPRLGNITVDAFLKHFITSEAPA